MAGADHHVPGARPVRHAVAISGDPGAGSVLLGLFLIFVARPLAVWLCLFPFRFPRAETAFISWVGLRGAVSILLAITPLLGGLEHGRDDLQRRLHHRAGVAGRAGLDRRPAGAPARPDRAGPHRPARQGRARIAGLGASRAARLHRRARQPGGARRAHPALGAALAGRARRPLDALPGHGPADGRRPRLHLRAGPLSAPARPAVRQPHRGRSGGRRFLRRLRRRSGALRRRISKPPMRRA